MVYKIIKFYFFIFFIFTLCHKTEEKKEIKIHIGDLISQKNMNFDYVEGNIIDCRNISIQYLKGDIRGEKNLNIHINVMQGNIVSGSAKVNILDGNIINGNSVQVNILLGEDFSRKAQIVKKIDKKIQF